MFFTPEELISEILYIHGKRQIQRTTYCELFQKQINASYCYLNIVLF